ncbi:MAG: PDR/VanB family oxidoreductase [Alphaproteobacteria bacterium]|nr:PDR/VanB family oxidoreductase [Alphaproteobacteria bacterium]
MAQVQEKIKAKVMAYDKIATDIVRIELADPNGHALPEFTAGSHIDLHLPTTPELIRQYSLANDPIENHRYVIGVLREANSRGGSVAVHDRLAVGTIVTISAPRNAFALNETASHSILCAGGIGITPLLAMAQRLLRLKQSFELHYCVRSADRAAFMEILRRPEFADKIFLHCDDGDAAQKFDPKSVFGKAAGSATTHLYCCGPNGFMSYVLDAARAQKWPEERLHVEYFGAKPMEVSTEAASVGSFKVIAKKSGKEFTLQPGQSIAKTLIKGGIPIPVSCESGICGTCLTKVIEGRPDHQDSFQTDKEKASNKSMTVCCSGSLDPVIVLDV